MNPNELKTEVLGDCTVVIGVPDIMADPLKQLATQALSEDRPFFWLLKAFSQPPGELIPVSAPNGSDSLPEFKHPSRLNGYEINHITGIKALMGDMLNTATADEIADYFQTIMMKPEVVHGATLGLLRPVIGYLQCKRKKGETLTWTQVRKSLSAHRVLSALHDAGMPDAIRQAFNAYLSLVPGYRPGAPTDQQNPVFKNSHEGIQRDLTGLLSGRMRKMEVERQFILQCKLPLGRDGAAALCLDAWSKRHTNGLIILDGLYIDTRLLEWVMQARGTLKERGMRVVIALDDLDAFSPGDQNHHIIQSMLIEQQTIKPQGVAARARL